MFIVSLTYKVPLNEVEQHLDAHIAYIKQYYALAKFITSGRKVPRTGGVILLNAKNATEADKIVKQDPFYIEGVADFDIIEFIPSMAAEGYEALISPQ